MKNTAYPKLFVGPMTKTVVDACIEYANENDIPLGLIPSRRQIDMFTGYVNKWKTHSFASYVRSKTSLVLLQRDHGGPSQGDRDDDGLESLQHDGLHFDLLHIDPFKKHKSLDSAAAYTINTINSISKFSSCEYEIGTEEAIFSMTPEDADTFFSTVEKGTGNNFDKVKYLVVQFGTKIIGTRNTGQFDMDRANRMIDLCKRFDKLSKEHNGDYLSVDGVKTRRELGLDALNIAPEMGGIETECLIEEIENKVDLLDRFFECCISTNRWQKWFPKDFDPNNNKLDLLRACGHYCFASPTFLELIENIDYSAVTEKAKTRIKKRIKELL